MIDWKASTMEKFAEDELRRAGFFLKDSVYGGMMGAAVLRLIRALAREGHSGASAGIAISMFSRLASFEPLSPLTGEDGEWVEVVVGSPLQNRRCPRVFKGSDGQAYDMHGRVFRYPDGVTFTSRDSFVPVTFPYTPRVEIIDVPEDGK